MTPAGFAFAVVGASLGCLIESFRKQNQKESERDKQKSFDTYVNTGMKDKNFYRLSWRAERLAEKQRRSRIRERTNPDFTAWAECPSCGANDFHAIQAIHHKNQCLRQCNTCTFKWSQK